MENHERLIAELEKIPWFQMIKSEHLQKIAEMTQLRTIKAGISFFGKTKKRSWHRSRPIPNLRTVGAWRKRFS